MAMYAEKYASAGCAVKYGKKVNELGVTDSSWPYPDVTRKKGYPLQILRDT
jgi:hypothetical protein